MKIILVECFKAAIIVAVCSVMVFALHPDAPSLSGHFSLATAVR